MRVAYHFKHGIQYFLQANDEGGSVKDKEWNEKNEHWIQSETLLLNSTYVPIEEQFTSQVWLEPSWSNLLNEQFSSEEIEHLATHFQTEIGKQQTKN